MCIPLEQAATGSLTSGTTCGSFNHARFALATVGAAASCTLARRFFHVQAFRQPPTTAPFQGASLLGSSHTFSHGAGWALSERSLVWSGCSAVGLTIGCVRRRASGYPTHAPSGRDHGHTCAGTRGRYRRRGDDHRPHRDRTGHGSDPVRVAVTTTGYSVLIQWRPGPVQLGVHARHGCPTYAAAGRWHAARFSHGRYPFTRQPAA